MDNRICKCGHPQEEHAKIIGLCSHEGCDCKRFEPAFKAVVPLKVTFEPTEWKDISTEKARRYTFPGQEYIYILMPQWLHVSASNGHRIIDFNGVCHYIPPTWIHLTWWVKDGAPYFVA